MHSFENYICQQETNTTSYTNIRDKVNTSCAGHKMFCKNRFKAPFKNESKVITILVPLGTTYYFIFFISFL
jgi:hypothetical protein